MYDLTFHHSVASIIADGWIIIWLVLHIHCTNLLNVFTSNMTIDRGSTRHSPLINGHIIDNYAIALLLILHARLLSCDDNVQK